MELTWGTGYLDAGAEKPDGDGIELRGQQQESYGHPRQRGRWTAGDGKLETQEVSLMERGVTEG